MVVNNYYQQYLGYEFTNSSLYEDACGASAFVLGWALARYYTVFFLLHELRNKISAGANDTSASSKVILERM